jgi:hypothetical protein
MLAAKKLKPFSNPPQWDIYIGRKNHWTIFKKIIPSATHQYKQVFFASIYESGAFLYNPCRKAKRKAIIL